MSTGGYRKESTSLLDAIAFRLAITLMIAEELCCLFKQHMDNTAGRYRDCLYPGCPLFSSKDNCIDYVFQDGTTITVGSLNITEVPGFGSRVVPYWDRKFKDILLPSRKSWAPREKHPRQKFRQCFPVSLRPLNGREKSVRLRTIGIPSRLKVITSTSWNRVDSVHLDSVVKKALSGVEGSFPKFGDGGIYHQPKDYEVYQYEVVRVFRKGMLIQPWLQTVPNPPGTPKKRKRTRKKGNGPGGRSPSANFFRAGIITATGLAFPEATFELRPDYRKEEPVKGAENFLSSYSFLHEGARYFSSRENAKQFAAFWICLSTKHEVMRHPLAMNLFAVEEEGSVVEEETLHGRISAAGGSLAGVRVLHRRGDKSREPFLVNGLYKKGGKCHYLVSGSGVPLSGLVLTMPPPLCPRVRFNDKSGAMEVSEEPEPFLSVVGHDMGGTNPKCVVRLMVLWEDRETSMVDLLVFSLDNWWRAHDYASAQNLLGVKGFGSLRTRTKSQWCSSNVPLEIYEGYLQLNHDGPTVMTLDDYHRNHRANLTLVAILMSVA